MTRPAPAGSRPKMPPRVPVTARIPDRARPAWSVLTLALINVDPPCAGPDGHLWTSEQPEERAAAALLCQGCPVLLPCSDYATTAREVWNTWAAVDRTIPRTTTKGAP